MIDFETVTFALLIDNVCQDRLVRILAHNVSTTAQTCVVREIGDSGHYISEPFPCLSTQLAPVGVRQMHRYKISCYTELHDAAGNVLPKIRSSRPSASYNKPPEQWYSRPHWYNPDGCTPKYAP